PAVTLFSRCAARCQTRVPFARSGYPPGLRSFPTRRSSDLFFCAGRSIRARRVPVVDSHQPTDGTRQSIVTAGARLRSVDANQLQDRKSTRLNSSHVKISYAVFCLKKKNQRKLAPHGGRDDR